MKCASLRNVYQLEIDLPLTLTSLALALYLHFPLGDLKKYTALNRMAGNYSIPVGSKCIHLYLVVRLLAFACEIAVNCF